MHDDSLTIWLPDILPAYWNEESYERTQRILRDWLNEPTTLMVAVPSVVPMSYNFLIHPAHSAFSQIWVLHQEPFLIGRRHRQQENP